MAVSSDIDPWVIEKASLQMYFDSIHQDYGGSFVCDGTYKNSREKFGNGFASPTSYYQKGCGFGKRVANDLENPMWEVPDKIASLTVRMSEDLYKRIHFEKYLFSYLSKTGATLLKWDRPEHEDFPVTGELVIGNLNLKEFIAVLAVAIKENASRLGTRYASFDIPALEKVPEINQFMQKHLSRSK